MSYNQFYGNTITSCRAGIDITYVELPSNKGHMASHADAALWAPILGAFLKRLP